MSGAKEIRTKIASIKNTQKITKAMEMVAASKMRKAQDRMFATRPYAAKIRNVIGHPSHAHPEYHHPYLQERETKRVGLIVISTDRGLCGGLNINLFKKIIGTMKEWDAAGIEIDGPAATVTFDEPQLGVAPGQGAALYDGDRLLGGGWIAETVPAAGSPA